MQNTTLRDPQSPPPSTSVVTRAPVGSQNDTAQPSLTSGFGTVIEKEYELRNATADSLARDGSVPPSAQRDYVLRQQHSALGASIALLEQRYEALPHAGRFATWQQRDRATGASRARGTDEMLSDLIAQHTRLIVDIDALIQCAADGQRGELILTEVRRNHEEMARDLTALTANTTSGALTDETSVPPAAVRNPGQERWDNEGGSVAP